MRPAILGVLACSVTAAHAAVIAARAGNCSRDFRLPGDAPLQASDYNGWALPEVCFKEGGPHNVYVIGDWGGIRYADRMPPIPADKRSKLFPKFHRDFVYGVDDRAQLLVADQMRKRAKYAPPDYILNVGDNFYWGGVSAKCGGAPFTNHDTGQWENIFEKVYWGAGLDGKTWLGIMGNHDYGGYHFTAAWEQNIGYSWGGPHSTGRWLTAAQYYRQKVSYVDFSVDYYFLDTNVMDTWDPRQNPSHNLCGLAHNGRDATCGAQGPRDVWSCVGWFASLWEEQLLWLEASLNQSEATWQVIVTHFPTYWGAHDWGCLADRYGIDLFLSGHMHYQKVIKPDDPQNHIMGSTVVITGGGGGITSEHAPDLYGNDDMYGFVHLTLSKDVIKVEFISHSGWLRSTTYQEPRWGNRQGGQCITAPNATHFTPVDGGEGRACRGSTATDDAGSNFLLLEGVPSQEACMRHCHSTPQCTGIEFGNHVCEVWTVEINASAAVEGYACLKLAPGEGPDPEVEPQSAGASLELRRAMGQDRECRGAEAGDRSPAYFDATEAPTLEGCERLCLSRAACAGIEYGPGNVCNVWRTALKASVPREGVVCIPSHHPEAGDARLPEIAGLLHV